MKFLHDSSLIAENMKPPNSWLSPDSSQFNWIGKIYLTSRHWHIREDYGRYRWIMSLVLLVWSVNIPWWNFQYPVALSSSGSNSGSTVTWLSHGGGESLLFAARSWELGLRRVWEPLYLQVFLPCYCIWNVFKPLCLCFCNLPPLAREMCFA